MGNLMPRWLRRKPAFFGIALAPLVLVGAAWVTLGQMDEHGRRFFETGRAAVETLGQLARSLKSRDFAAASNLYAPDFHGSPLGLASFRKAGETDGVETLRFASS